MPLLGVPARAVEPVGNYLELLRRYANGERGPAVAALGASSVKDVERQVNEIELGFRAVERCPSCPRPLAGTLLRAGVMLHVDRDQADRPESSGVEQPRPCPGRHARLAGRLAGLLARDRGGADFAASFFRAIALRCQWDFCLEAALDWVREGSKLFPRDGALLFLAGSVHEEAATLGADLLESPAVSRGRDPLEAARVRASRRERGFSEARRLYQEATLADPETVVGRLRLGRVQWQLGDGEAARHTLEQALLLAREPRQRYLAHLYLGRVHEDAQRLEQAIAQYRSAVALQPAAQTGAVALSHALRSAGDVEAAWEALQRGLTRPGPREPRDPFWDSMVGNGVHPDELFEALRRETLF